MGILTFFFAHWLYIPWGGGLDLLLRFRESNVVYEVGSPAPRGGAVG